MGKAVFQTGKPTLDFISFSKTHTWYDPEWLSSTLIYIIQNSFGFNGLIILKAFLMFLTFLAMPLALKLNSKNNPYNIIFYSILIFFAYITNIITVTVRCQLITFFLLTLWIILLEEIRKGKTKLLFFLPPIMLFWLNAHGACIAGVGVLFLYIIGEFLNKKPIKNYVVAFIFTLLVFLINPWGFEYIPFITKSAFIDRSWIIEWISPLSKFLKHLNFFIYVVIFTLVAYAFKIILNKKKFSELDKTKLLLTFVLSFLSLSHMKHIWLYLVIISIFYYDDFCHFFNYLTSKLKQYLQIPDKDYEKISSIKEYIVYAFLILFSLKTFIFDCNELNHKKRLITTYPVYPLEFILKNNLKGNILAPFHMSSYLAYKAYPNIKIYMDGRQEQVYYENSMKELMDFSTWNEQTGDLILKNNDIDYIILTRKDRVILFLSELKNYTKIYDDSFYIILAKKELEQFYYLQPEKNQTMLLKNIFNTNINFRKEEK